MMRLWIALIALAAGVVGGYWVGARRTHGPDELLTSPKPGPRPMTEWYYADGRIDPDTVAALQGDGTIRSPAREWIVVLNPGDSEADVSLTFYFETMAPRHKSWKVAPGGSQSLPVQEIADVVPHGILYGARVRSNVPVLVQPTRGEYEPHNPVTHAMASFIAHPGPLGSRETKWAYADGLVLRSEGPLEEREWVSILNPAPEKQARVRIRFLRTSGEQSHELGVPAERVKTVDLFTLPAFVPNTLSGVVVESDAPVVVEQVRRAYQRGVPVIASMWACLAHPIGPEERR